MFKKILPIAFLSALLIFNSCREAEIKPTLGDNENVADTFLAHPKAAQLQAVIDKYKKLGLPGIAVLVRQGDRTFVGNAGFADIDEGTKFTHHTIAKTASLTKIMMATLTLKLVEDGTLQLDEKISKWLDVAMLKKINNAENATLRSLLNHTTGIYDVITDNGFYLAVLNYPDKKWTQEELLEFVYGKPAEYEYGSTSGYSNTNTLLVSMIIDKATGRSHADLLKERIFMPLGMRNTYYYWQQDLPANKVAQGYYDLYNNKTLVNVSNYNTGSGNGYTGVYSNVLDLQVFIDALFRYKTLLKQSSLDEMTKFATNIESRKYLGLGIFKDYIDGPFDPAKDYGLGHRGRDLGYSADMFYFPEHDITLTLLVNYGTDAESALRPVFLNFKEELADVALHN